MARSVHLARIVVVCLVCIIVLGGIVPEMAMAARVLRQGMTGSDVRELQQRLVEWGHPLPIDGKFGPVTAAAVRAFQKSLGLTVDGIVGNQTWEEIRKAPTLIHRVKRGDSLYILARSYGVSIEAIMDANDLTDEIIIIGRELTIPQGRTVTASGQSLVSDNPPEQVYQVRPGDSASVIAKKFNTSVPALAEANRLADPNRLRAGQKLVIPGWQANMPRFAWPVRGRISSSYGWRVHPIYKNRQFHGGIDIAVPVGTSVRAAANGKVIRSGYMGAFGYGIVIDHGRGVTTWYGHNSRLSVKVGEKVRQGQVIARSGSSGVSTGPHVDFRIKLDAETVNPVHWLP
ncbi:MAG: peptidoglycan DD-metalloendopeptidase family protein [Firmicutes bacterium]|nr:peptidoglycan DD-metalloendopeptidase family protein [Bacillota bacterium]